MSVAARVFRGYGNGSVVGTVADRVHRGYTPFIPVPPASKTEEILYAGIDSEITIQSMDTEITLNAIDTEIIYNG
jgi:hypothetical protein